MKSIFVGFALTASFAFAGCGSDAIKEFESVSEKVCACKDIKCAEKALGAMENVEEPKELSDSDKKKISELSMKMSACMEKLTEKETAK